MRTKIIRITWSNPEPIDDVIASIPEHQIGLYYITRKFNSKETSLYLRESIDL